MVTDQAAIIQAIAQVAVEDVKAAVQAMATAVSECYLRIRSDPVHMGHKLGVPTLKQPTFDWEVTENKGKSKTSH